MTPATPTRVPGRSLGRRRRPGDATGDRHLSLRRRRRTRCGGRPRCARRARPRCRRARSTVIDLRVRQRADAHLQQEAVVAEDLVLEEDLLDHLLGLPTRVRAAQLRSRRRTARGVIGGQPRSRPMRFIIAAVGGKNSSAACLRRLGDEAVRVDAERQRRSWPACVAALAVELDERREALRLAADDRERQRQAEHAGADDRLRRAADRDPDRQRLLQRARDRRGGRRAARGGSP